MIIVLGIIVVAGLVAFYLFKSEAEQEVRNSIASNNEREQEQKRLQEQQRMISARKSGAPASPSGRGSGLHVDVRVEENPEPWWSHDNAVYVDHMKNQIEETYRMAALSRMGMDPTPSKLMRKRTDLRRMYREAVAAGDEEREIEALEGLYRYALLVVYCYGSDENKASVQGWQYDAAAKALWSNDVEKIFSAVEYRKDGRIKDCRCLSETDWKHFEKRWGKVDGEVDMKNLVGTYPGLAMC